jgi:hypothetical protein
MRLIAAMRLFTAVVVASAAVLIALNAVRMFPRAVRTGAGSMFNLKLNSSIV